MILSKIPLVTFLMTCIMIYFTLARYNKERKALVALMFIGAIGCFFLTIKNLNNIYFSLTEYLLAFVNIVIVTCAIIAIILIIYCAITKKDKHPYGKLPKL